MAESLLDAITGGLLGVAAGDALGATVEFMQPEEIEHEHGVHRFDMLLTDSPSSDS